jgi:hypothetical protein
MVQMGATKHHLELGNGLKTQEEVLLMTKETFIAAATSENTIKGIKRNDWMDWVVQHNTYSSFASSAFQVMLVCHAPISQRVFFYFDCNILPGNLSPETTRGFLRSDYSIECYRDIHGGFMPVVIFFMIFFVFAIPGYIAFALWQERHYLRSPRVVQKIGFLYKRFTIGSEGWELISVIRKLILIGLLVFLPPVARAATALAAKAARAAPRAALTSRISSAFTATRWATTRACARRRRRKRRLTGLPRRSARSRLGVCARR